MPSPRFFKSEALVLRTAQASEANVMATLLLRDGAKLRGVAYGARKLNSRKMGHLNPLTRVDAMLSRARDFHTIDQASALESFGDLKSDLKSTANAICMAELTDGFAVEGGANPRLYRLLLYVLRTLNGGGAAAVSLPWFQMNLLAVNGLLPELNSCVECREEAGEKDVGFSIGLGGVLCRRCLPKQRNATAMSAAAAMALRRLPFTRDCSQLNEQNTPPSTLSEVKFILDSAVRYWLDRDVRAQRFADHMRRRPAVRMGMPERRAGAVKGG